MFLSSFVILLSGLVLCDLGGVCNGNSAASAIIARADGVGSVFALCRGDQSDGAGNGDIATIRLKAASYTGSI